MDNIQPLREKLASLANLANKLLADKGDQTWTKEEQSTFDNYTTEIVALKNQVKAVETMRELEADTFVNASPSAIKEGVTIDALAAVALYMRFGNNVNPEQALAIRNAMSTTTPSEGGFTVPAEIAALVIERLKSFGGMREVAEILTTETGIALNFPTNDGTAEVGAIVGQNTLVNVAETVFGTVALPVFNYTSNQIALPLELVKDSAINIIDFVVNRLAERIARIQNTHFTLGGGTTLPDGIVPRSGVGKTGATGTTLTVTYDDIVDLKHSVNRAYRGNAKFMLNDLSVAVVSKLKDTTGRPIWTPSITAGAPDMLLGHAVVTNDDVAVMAANARSIVFGDLSKYVIRDVTGTTRIGRYEDSAFALKGQIGFCGWQRSGGNLLNTDATRVFVNSAT